MENITEHLDNQEIMQRLDTENMYDKIIHLPEQIMNAYFNPNIYEPQTFEALAAGLKSKPIRRVVLVGMGGSAISGDLLSAAYDTIIPIQVYKDYQVPVIKDDDLFIACSYSGNTEETVSCLEQAIKRTSYIAGVTSGGIVEKELKDKYFLCGLPPGNPPRSAIGYLFFSLLIILERFGLIDDMKADVEQTVSSLMQKAGALSKTVGCEFNLAKQSAAAINGKIPLLYSSNPVLYPIAYRWKCQINENSKYPAFCHSFPEMNHNEIEAWENNRYNEMFMPVFLNEFKEKHCYQKRIDFFKKTMNKEGVGYLDFYAEGDCSLEKTFSLIYLGDMISYYLAILQEVNPTTINLIVRLKKEIE